MQQKKQIAPNQRYCTMSLETLDTRCFKSSQGFFNNQNQNSENQINQLRRAPKLRTQPNQLHKNQENQIHSDSDNIQEWVNHDRKRSKTNIPSALKKSFDIEHDDIIRRQEQMSRNFHMFQDSSVKRSVEIENCGKRHLNIESNYLDKGYKEQQKIRNQAIDQMSIKQPHLQTFENQKTCHNCQFKKAKYHLLNNKNPNLFFCSKCSVKLLQKGFQVEEIDEWQNSKVQHMRTQVLMFMDRLSMIYNATQQNIKEIEKGRDQTSFNLEKENICNIYQEMFDVLEKMKQRDIESIEKIANETMTQRENAHLRLIDQLQQIKYMQNSMQQTLNNVSKMQRSQVQKVIQIATEDLMQFRQYKFASRPMQPPPYDIRLQSLFNRAYEYLVDGQYSIQSSFSQNPLLNGTDATIEQVKEPFRFLFPDDNDRQNTRKRIYGAESISRGSSANLY